MLIKTKTIFLLTKTQKIPKFPTALSKKLEAFKARSFGLAFYLPIDYPESITKTLRKHPCG